EADWKGEKVISAMDYIICLGFANDSSVLSVDWGIEAVQWLILLSLQQLCQQGMDF
ncbi:unnamed protein product, partial [Bubo scandiacus]